MPARSSHRGANHRVLRCDPSRTSPRHRCSPWPRTLRDSGSAPARRRPSAHLRADHDRVVAPRIGEAPGPTVWRLSSSSRSSADHRLARWAWHIRTCTCWRTYASKVASHITWPRVGEASFCGAPDPAQGRVPSVIQPEKHALEFAIVAVRAWDPTVHAAPDWPPGGVHARSGVRGRGMP